MFPKVTYCPYKIEIDIDDSKYQYSYLVFMGDMKSSQYWSTEPLMNDHSSAPRILINENGRYRNVISIFSPSVFWDVDMLIYASPNSPVLDRALPFYNHAYNKWEAVVACKTYFEVIQLIEEMKGIESDWEPSRIMYEPAADSANVIRDKLGDISIPIITGEFSSICFENSRDMCIDAFMDLVEEFDMVDNKRIDIESGDTSTFIHVLLHDDISIEDTRYVLNTIRLHQTEMRYICINGKHNPITIANKLKEIL